MKVYRAAAMREADRLAPARGVPLARLMQRAGAGMAREAVQAFPEVREWHVLAGPGNNGGDGWVAALQLLKRGRPARVWELPRRQ
ncbi:MAG TPA: NAD(P)H-hydrate epimerase, partial [Deinococcales bacterium]|nr:NAD(P)H-hydrate epimerase [Deinococcales bacterium]